MTKRNTTETNDPLEDDNADIPQAINPMTGGGVTPEDNPNAGNVDLHDASDSIFESGEDQPSTEFIVGRPRTQNTATIEVPAEYKEQIEAMLGNIVISNPDGVRLAVDQQIAAAKANERSGEANDDAAKAHQDRMKKMGLGDGLKNLPPELAMRELRAMDKLEAKTLKMDHAPQGGQSIVNGVLVWNRNGKPVNPEAE